MYSGVRLFESVKNATFLAIKRNFHLSDLQISVKPLQLSELTFFLILWLLK